MMRLFLWFRDLCLDFLFPKSREVLELEALSAEALLELLPAPQRLITDSSTIALFDYTHPLVKKVIWEVKYAGNRKLSLRVGEIIYDVIVEELNERNVLSKWHTVILMPMPISDRRRFERGWNQAELLTEAIKSCDKSHILKHVPRQLAKITHTESQTKTANRNERINNLAGSMRVMNPEIARDKYVVLVDDVLTTGSTFAEAKRAL